MKNNKVVVLLNTPSFGLRPPFPSRGEGNSLRGFALIELLVVVLIIGLLAAVALPQYQKAVDKARAAEFITVLSKVNQAVKRCYLEKGTFYGCHLKNLDIEIPNPKNFTFGGSSNEIYLELVNGINLQLGTAAGASYKGDDTMKIRTRWIATSYPITFTSICTGNKCKSMFNCPDENNCYLFNETW